MSPRTRRLTLPALVATAATALTVTALPTASQAAAPAAVPASAHGLLTGAVPAWAHTDPVAAEPAAARVDLVVQLATRDTAGLRRLDAAVSNPASPSYRHFLSPAAYRARFAPSAAHTATVTSWLRGAGFTVDRVTADRTLVAVHAPAATVAQAFSTTFGLFDVDGARLRAPLSTPVVPTAIGTLVANVAGLAQSPVLTPDAGPSTAFVNARPCSSYYGQKTAKKQPAYQGTKQAYAVCGYTGKTLRHAYGLDKTGLSGAGATVGIVDAFASPTIEADANTYSRKHGIPTFRGGQFSQVLPPGETSVPEDPSGLLLDPQGWAGEETLDVEAVHATAPGAKVVYYAATTPYGPALYLALNQAVSGGRVQIVSNSYGTGSDSPDASDKMLFDQITSEAAATGVTIDFSSGDSGDETDPSAAGTRTADFPATSTGVVAVGGTSLQVDKAGNRTGETYWGTRKDLLVGNHWDFAPKDVVYSGAGGGGVSTSYAEPAWQKKVVPAQLTTYGGLSTPGRVVPDISMEADSTTGMLVGQTEKFADGSVKYGEYRIGGTSLSCPLFSGMLAQVVGKRGGKGVGLVTPSLYKFDTHRRVRQQVYFDPTGVKVDKTTHQSVVANVRPDFTAPDNPSSKVTYSLRTLGNLATLHRLVGYDDSTGLGSPNGRALVAKLTGTKVGGHH